MFDFGRVFSRVFSDRIYNRLFGFRNNLEFRGLQIQINEVKSTIKMLIKKESKWLKISPTGKLRPIELNYLEHHYDEATASLMDIQECLKEKIEVSFDIAVNENIPSWVQVLETPTLKYLEIASGQLKAVQSALQDINNDKKPDIDEDIEAVNTSSKEVDDYIFSSYSVASFHSLW